jgi:hypothetical protein
VTTRDTLRRLIDELPESEIETVHLLVEHRHKLRQEPLLLLLATAPLDDEPSTPEEDAEAEEAWQEYLRGESVSSDDAKRELLG